MPRSKNQEARDHERGISTSSRTAAMQLLGSRRIRLCVVRNQELIDFWRTDRIVPDRPLVRYIDDAFRIAWSNGNYDVLVRK